MPLYRECCTKCHSRTFASNVLRLCTKDEMQGAEDEDEGSVLMYVTEARIPKATQQIAFVQQSLIDFSSAERHQKPIYNSLE